MISLQDYSGLPLLLNNQDYTLHPAGEISIKCTERVRLDMIRPTLLNKTLKYPLHVYTEYCDITMPKHEELFSKNNLHYNMLVVPPGLLGIEYNKTHIFAPDKDRNELTAIVDVVYGRGLVLIQKPRDILDESSKEDDKENPFAAMFLIKKGDRIPVPQGYLYTFVNSSNSALVIGRLFEDDGKIDYRSIRWVQGMSHYFIRKNARREVVKNPRYRDVDKIKVIKCDKYSQRFRLTSTKPIYTQCVQNVDRFKDILV